MAKIDRTIAFVESNSCMIESLKSQDDDQDVVSYIINVLKHYKKNPQEQQLPGNQGNTKILFTPIIHRESEDCNGKS